MKLRIHDAAVEELREAALYYEREAEGLGEAFLVEVEHAFELLIDSPRSDSRPTYSEAERRSHNE